MYADNWWTVATSNIFLGIQQSLVWSATIFVMIDYLGQENSGIAVGINETGQASAFRQYLYFCTSKASKLNTFSSELWHRRWNQRDGFSSSLLPLI
jgi:hypothetical protein